VASKVNGAKKMGGKKTYPEERQALLMWALLSSENGGAYQMDLKPKPEAAVRDALKGAGLIEWRKVPRGRSRPIWMEVTEKGWGWANDNLGHTLPAGAEILHRWLVKLDAYMKAHDLALADVLGTQVSQNGANGDKPRIIVRSGTLRDRIRAAYLEATGGRFNTRALLKDIRARLADVERGALDEALKTMQREDDALLYPLDNHAEITDADRAAAISFADEPRHILWITK
jgi:hypothetical protein